MKAMILAAGRGERMRPLTDTLPKPLLEIKDKPLIVYIIEKLAQNGFKEIVINIAHLGQKIIDTLDDGSCWGIKIIYSDERVSGALESAGGIKKALPLLGESTFLVVNADVWCDYEFDNNFDLGEKLAHLILVKNPEHNKKGDFSFDGKKVLNSGENMFTFSGIGYYNPKLFKQLPDGKYSLAPILRECIKNDNLSSEVHNGIWRDVGTPQRLQELCYNT